MKSFIKPFSLLIMLAALCCVIAARAGFQLNSGPVYVTIPTNSSPIINPGPLQVTMPLTTVITSGVTNPGTQYTNSFCQSFTNNGTVFFVQFSTVWNASSNGLTAAAIGNPLSCTNTYNAQQFNIPNWSFMNISPQTGPGGGTTNTFSISSQ